VNHQLDCLALELLVVSFLSLLFFHGFSHFILSFRVRQIGGGSRRGAPGGPGGKADWLPANKSILPSPTEKPEPVHDCVNLDSHSDKLESFDFTTEAQRTRSLGIASGFLGNSKNKFSKKLCALCVSVVN
jgi:hypothetical protein